MQTSKAWWASKTIWAGVITVLLTAYNAASEAFGLPAMPDFIYAILGALGIYGRVDATKTVK